MKAKPNVAETRLNKTGMRDSQRTVYFLLLSLLLIGYAVLHFVAAYNLPTPWRDEAHFMWQAAGFAEHFTFFSPELNGERTIFWMPPGYFVVLGLVIKLFGLTLIAARSFSLLCSLVVIVLLVTLAKRFVIPWVAVMIATPFVLGIPFVATGNIARMEPLLLVLILAGCLNLFDRKIVTGLVLLALSPLVHPNGIPFFLAALIGSPFLLSYPIKWRRPYKSEIVAGSLLVLLWLAYAIYLSQHWANFREDLAFQLKRKADRDILSAVLTYGSVLLCVFTIAGIVYCVRRKLHSIFLLIVAVPAWWVAAAGVEMWYRIFFSVSFFCFTVCYLTIVADIYGLIQIRWKRIVAVGAISACLLVVIAWNVKQGPQSEPLVFPDFRPWHDMTYSAQPYMISDETKAIELRLRGAIASKSYTRIEFYPEADAFYFARLRSSNTVFNCPLFSTQNADWYLFHFATRIPDALNKISYAKLQELGISGNDVARFAILRRDSTSAWFLVPGNPQ